MSLHLISPGGIFVKKVQKYFSRVGTTRVVPEVPPLRDSSCFQLKAPRKGLRIHYTDPAPFVFCEFCKSMHTNGNAPQGPEKQVYRNSEVRRSGVRCAAGCCIKSVKSVFRARARRAGAMRGSL